MNLKITLIKAILKIFCIAFFISCYSNLVEINSTNVYTNSAGETFYEKKLFTGIVNKYNDHNFLKSKLSYKNGILNGAQIGFHENGKISYQYSTKNGRKEGHYKEYYPNGNLQIQALYQSDTIVTKKIIDINGSVIANYRYRNGRIYGLLGSTECFTVFNKESYKSQH